MKALFHVKKFDEVLINVEACLPKDAQGSFIAARRNPTYSTTGLAFLAEQML